MATTSVRNNGGTMVSPLPQSKCLFTCNRISSLALACTPLHCPVLTLARRRNNVGRPISKKNKSRSKADIGKDNDLDEDAFEALFKQLEEDLKKDEESLGDGGDDISEEDLAMLERELEEALADDEDLSELLSLMAGNSNGFGIDSDEQTEEIIDHVEVEDEEKEDDGVEEKDEDDDDNEEPIKLKGWQLRRLAKALKVGRRKTSNAMISSIVQATNIPRKRVVKWFEDRRSADGVPEQRRPYQSPTSSLSPSVLANK